MRFKGDIARLPATLDVREEFEELANIPRALFVKLPLPIFPAQVVELTLTCELNPAASRNAAVDHPLCILFGNRSVIAFTF